MLCAKPGIRQAVGQEPAMPIIQADASPRAHRQPQQRILDRAELEREVVKVDHHIMPPQAENPAQITRTQHGCSPIKCGLIERADLVHQTGPLHDRRAVGAGQQRQVRIGQRFPQRLNRGRRQHQITHIGQLYQQDTHRLPVLANQASMYHNRRVSHTGK
jgi:hypothetical protein